MTTPYSPEQNGVVEQKNRTVVEMARSMLQEKGVPNQFWAEAVVTSVHLLNLSPTKVVIHQTPFEAWMDRKPAVSYLRIFGCIAYALVNSQFRHKLDEKSEKCIFIGYCTQSKAYRLYNPLSRKILIRRDVVFDEMASWNWSGSNGKKQEQILTPTGITFDGIQQSTPTATEVSSSTSSQIHPLQLHQAETLHLQLLNSLQKSQLHYEDQQGLQSRIPSMLVTCLRLVSFLLLFQIQYIMKKQLKRKSGGMRC